MKKYYCENEKLNEALVNNGINLICNESNELIISDDDAYRIDKLVKDKFYCAIGDYIIEDINDDTDID